MIKFFRKIRQRLLTENKFSKYLIYAIGEIVLVVIGILIALALNNWSEKAKEIDFAVKEVENLSQNLYDTNLNNSEIYFLQIQDSVIQSLRNDDDSIYPNYTRWYDKNPLSIGRDLQYTMTENFDLVLNLEKSFPVKYNSVIKSIKYTKNIYKNTLPYLDILTNIERRNNEILSKRFGWYDDYSPEALIKRHEYFVKDSLFQNRLFEYTQSFDGYASQVNRLRMLKAKVWLEVEILSPNKSLNGINNGLNKMNLAKSSEVSCSEIFKENKLPSFIIWNLIYNSTKDTIQIATWNGKEPNDFIAPNSIEVISGRKNDGIKIFKNGQCAVKYNNLISGFIIIQ